MHLRLAVDALAAVVSSPVVLEVLSILIAAGMNAEHGAAVLNAFFVFPCPVLGNTIADQRTDESAGRSPCASSRKRSCDRSPDDEAEARKNEIGAEGCYAADHCAQRPADDAARPRSLGCLIAKFGVCLAVTVIFIAGFVRHHHVYLVLRITAVAQRLVCALGAFFVRKKTGHNAGFAFRTCTLCIHYNLPLNFILIKSR